MTSNLSEASPLAALDVHVLSDVKTICSTYYVTSNPGKPGDTLNRGGRAGVIALCLFVFWTLSQSTDTSSSAKRPIPVPSCHTIRHRPLDDLNTKVLIILELHLFICSFQLDDQK